MHFSAYSHETIPNEQFGFSTGQNRSIRLEERNFQITVVNGNAIDDYLNFLRH